MTHRIVRTGPTILVFVVAAGVAAGQQGDDRPRGWKTEFSPGSDLYPRYIADPRRPVFAFTSIHVADVEIPQSGSSRYGIHIGGRYGLLRLHPEGSEDRGIQIDVELGFVGQFDTDNNTDNIGWDGLYGLQISWKPLERLAFRVGTFHDSAHVGDEYAERTARQRVNYTREEVYLGVSWLAARHLHAYLEGASAFDQRNEALQEPFRCQIGLIYDGPPKLWRRFGFYAAGDSNFYQESDWDGSLAIQVGLRYDVKEMARVFRLGLQYYDGRSWMGEFFFHRERYVALGLWFDL